MTDKLIIDEEMNKWYKRVDGRKIEPLSIESSKNWYQITINKKIIPFQSKFRTRLS